jgi:RNA polymerase sigma factor (sigma-70 family)
MNRLLDFLRVRLTPAPEVTDRHLLDHFLATRDEAAFVELVRRYAPLVWGACRRRFAVHDAEDAFQATFLVLLRRAARLGADVPLGPWLHKVAVMTARNIARGNRRRTAVSGPIEHDVAAPETVSSVECFDLDDALLSLPERDRAAIVLCHLQGLSRREAAARLRCPQGTLSARLSRALERLRARLDGVPAILAAAGAVAVPSELNATMVRVGMIYTTSNLTMTGVSPVVIRITEGVLRMLWLKKLTVCLAFAALVAGGVCIGLTVRPGSAARASDPVLTAPLATEPQASPNNPEAAKPQVEDQLKKLTDKAAELEQALAATKAEKAKLEEEQREKARALKLDGCLDIVCHMPGAVREPLYTVSEVIGGKVREMSCNDMDMLTTYVTRAFNDPKGPKKLNVHENSYVSQDQSMAVLAMCARVGYTKAVLFQAVQPLGQKLAYEMLHFYSATDLKSKAPLLSATEVERVDKRTEIDLTKPLPPKKP